MPQKSVVDNYSIEELRKIVKNATYMKDVLKVMGLKDDCYYNRCTVKNRLERYGIDYSHFEENSRNQKAAYLKKGQRKTPLDEILVKDSKYKDMNHLKARLIRKGIFENKCGKCGQKPMWKRKKLPLFLTLINNVSQDFRLENLIILCPNCRSQVVTERTIVRNKKRGQKSKKMKQMKRELYKMTPRIDIRKVKDRPSGAELLKMRENEKMSLTAIGNKYGVSRSTIKKWFISSGLD